MDGDGSEIQNRTEGIPTQVLSNVRGLPSRGAVVTAVERVTSGTLVIMWISYRKRGQSP